MSIEGNFHFVDEHPTSCPDAFVVIFSGPATFQRTIVRRAGEDDSNLRGRVLSTVRLLAQRLEPSNPYSVTHGGYVVCHYDATGMEEGWRSDGLPNFQHALFRMAVQDPSARARSYAQSLLVAMHFGNATDPGTAQ